MYVDHPFAEVCVLYSLHWVHNALSRRAKPLPTCPSHLLEHLATKPCGVLLPVSKFCVHCFSSLCCLERFFSCCYCIEQKIVEQIITPNRTLPVLPPQECTRVLLSYMHNTLDVVIGTQ